MGKKSEERKKLIKTIVVVVSIVAVSSAIMIYFGTDYLVGLVDKYDLIGFFILITVMNVVVQPVSPDIVIAGSPFFMVHSTFSIAVVSAIAGVMAGMIAYGLGKSIGLTGFESYFGKKNTEKGCALYEKWGVWAIVISTVTPVPYSLICWMAGIFKMKLAIFIPAIVLTRAPRHIIVAYYGVEIVNYFQQIGLIPS